MERGVIGRERGNVKRVNEGRGVWREMRFKEGA